MPDLIDSMRAALADYSGGRAQQPLRTVLELGDERSFFGIMPASLADPRAVGTKLVTVFPSNHEKGCRPTWPRSSSWIRTPARCWRCSTAATSPRHGPPRFLPYQLTSWRCQDAATLAIIGSGVQARSHLEALGMCPPPGGRPRVEPDRIAPRGVRQGRLA